MSWKEECGKMRRKIEINTSSLGSWSGYVCANLQVICCRYFFCVFSFYFATIPWQNRRIRLYVRGNSMLFRIAIFRLRQCHCLVYVC